MTDDTEEITIGVWFDTLRCIECFKSMSSEEELKEHYAEYHLRG